MINFSMRLFSLFILIIILFMLGLFFIRGRKVVKSGLSVYLIPILLVSGLLFIVIGKVAIFFAFLTLSLILLASQRIK